MSIGGLVARMALLKEQMKKKPCKRCGSHFDHEAKEECPHCGHLDEAGLERLISSKERTFQANRSLGMLFLVAAVIVGFLMLLAATT